MTNPIGLRIYVCHKNVAAGEIKAILNGNLSVRVSETGCIVVTVGQNWIDHHRPHVGGYYVVYEDGYASFSPAEAFEKGYTAV